MFSGRGALARGLFVLTAIAVARALTVHEYFTNKRMSIKIRLFVTKFVDGRDPEEKTSWLPAGVPPAGVGVIAQHTRAAPYMSLGHIPAEQCFLNLSGSVSLWLKLLCALCVLCGEFLCKI